MTYEKLESCPSCDYPRFENHLICKDYTVSKESFALVKCERCKLVFTNPRPNGASLPTYYKSNEYISHTDRATTLVSFIYKLIRSITLNQKEKLISQYSKKGTLLDYGCGTGDFIKYVRNKGWNTIGYEPDQDALKIAKRKSDSSFLSNLSSIDKEVDIITAWHVIEHVTDLKSTLKQLKKTLIPGGYMIIALPNLESLDAKTYKETWAAYDVPRHLYHFSQPSFLYLAKKMKLELIKTVPMFFDSYYVSLLSEKNKSGRNNYIQAIKTGLKSNKKAATSGEYSSLIYILKK